MNKIITYFIILFLTALSVFSQTSEPPDFPGIGSGPLINLNTGSNTVSGALATPDDSQDRFQVVVAAGSQLDNITFNYNTSGGSSANMTFNSSVLVTNSGSVSGTPYPAGTYTVLISSGFAIGNAWNMTFTVSGISNSAPVIGGALAGQTVNDNATINPFSSVTISDADGDNVSATITLDSNLKGVLTGSGLSGSGPYTISSRAPASLQSTLRALNFNPTDNRSATSETTTFTVVLNDGTDTDTDNTTTVVSNAVAPAVSSISVSGTPLATATSISFLVSFTESVTGVDSGDFSLDVEGSVTASIAGVSGTGNSRLVTVSSISGTGTLSIDLNSTGTGIADTGGAAISGGFVASGTHMVDRDAPSVVSVTVPADATYVAGQDLDFEVNFNESVNLTGAPELTIIIGSTIRQATYKIGLGSESLVFGYTVQAGELDTDGIQVVTLATNGGTIRDVAGNDANLTLNSIGNTSGVLVEAILPTITNVAVPLNGSYAEGENIDFNITFSEAVDVEITGGTPQLSINVGGVTRQASYVIGSGNTVVGFRYVVQAGETDTDGIEVGTLVTNGGTIQDAVGNDANLTLNNVGSTSSVLVDTTNPIITSVTVPEDGTYVEGQDLDFEINFNENVILTGAPQLNITIGSSTQQAAYKSGSGTSSLVFGYTIQPGESDLDGIVVEILTTNMGTIQDVASNNANLALNNIESTTGVLVDSRIELSITGLIGDDKVYDGTTNASATGAAALSGVVSGDEVSLSGTPAYTFATPNVGTGIEITTIGFSLSGADSAKYTLVQPTLSADITDIELSITGLTGDDKVYDGTTDSSASGTPVLSGVVSGDDVSISGTPVYIFASSDVGTGIEITSSGFSLTGADAVNYTLIQPVLSGTITPAELNVAGLTGNNKAYDGTTDATANGTAVLTGVVSGDEVSLSGTPVYTFISADVGTGIDITTTGFNLSGADSGNYTLLQPTLSADITGIELNITGLTGDDKAYDGTTDASASGTPALSGVVSGDEVSLSGTPVYTFISADVGTGIDITTTGFNLSGADSGNYTLVQPTLSADITGIELTITGLTGDDKIYDGTADASVSGIAVLSGVVSGDEVSLSGTPVYTFASADIGTGVEITSSGFSLTGADAVNYTVIQPVFSGNITPADLTITANSGQNKIFGSEEPVFTFTSSGFVPGEDESILTGELSREVGEDVGIYAIEPGTLDAGQNYTLSFISADFEILPATQTGLEFADNTFIYDGTIKSLVVTGEAEDAVVTYENNDQTEAGSYTVTVTVTRPNFLDEVLEATLTIDKAEAIITSDATQTFAYDGTLKNVIANLNHSETSLTYSPQQGYTDAGTYSISVEAEETTNYLAATQTIELVINKASQNITFDALASRSLEDDSDFQLEATASSGLEVSYSFSFSSAQPAATVTPAGFVELLTSGQIVITAAQTGNENYEAAQPVEQTLVITSSNVDVTSIIIDGEIYDNPGEEVYYLIDCENATSFVDVEVISEVNAQVSTGTNFSIDTPVPGIYRQQVVVTSQDGTQTRTYLIVVEKAFDFEEIIVQKYNNTLVVNNNPENNGGYSFVSYKWYKNGALVSERQTFSEGNLSSDQLDPNANYQAVMVTTSGDELRTCISTIQSTVEQKGLSLHQNPVKQGSMLKARAQYSEEELKNATFQVYDLNGRMLLSVPATGVENSIQLPDNLASGLYKLILITGQRQENVSFIRK